MPIEEFTTDISLKKCLDEWMQTLFLEDWIIKAKVASPDEMELEDVCGENSFDIQNRCCVIRILDKKYYGDRVMKYCAEKILVHELLHCKYNWLSPPDSMEGKYFDTLEHSLLEQMAKSLIMAKYGLTLDYFIA
jgi:hypothetical protein